MEGTGVRSGQVRGVKTPVEGAPLEGPHVTVVPGPMHYYVHLQPSKKLNSNV